MGEKHQTFPFQRRLKSHISPFQVVPQPSERDVSHRPHGWAPSGSCWHVQTQALNTEPLAAAEPPPRLGERGFILVRSPRHQVWRTNSENDSVSGIIPGNCSPALESGNFVSRAFPKPWKASPLSQHYTRCLGQGRWIASHYWCQQPIEDVCLHG